MSLELPSLECKLLGECNQFTIMFTDVPSDLKSDQIRLAFDKIVEVESDSERVPYYHFKILNKNNVNVGHINFRVGDTRYITLCAGHIGFEVVPEYRGHAYSYYACLALASFVRRHYDSVMITADPQNHPSNRIIEKLGAKFLEEIEVPETDPAYANGARRKRRYVWTP